MTLILILCLIASTFKISAQIKVNSSGYVGINNTNPTYRLDVNGDFKLVSTGSKTFLMGGSSFYANPGYGVDLGTSSYMWYVLTPQIAGHNLKNKLGLIKFGNNDNRKKKIYT